MPQTPAPAPRDDDYTELRRHAWRKRQVVMVDGNLTTNANNSEGGLSARAYRGGYWGFASAPDTVDASAAACLRQQAESNARAMARFGSRTAWALPGRHSEANMSSRAGRPGRRPRRSTTWRRCRPSAPNATPISNRPD